MTHRYYVLWGVLIHVIISLATLVKNMRQILCSDWLTEWAWWAHPAYSELTSLILLKKRIEWSGLEKFNNVYFKVPQSIASDIMSVFRGLKKHFREGLRFVLWSQRFLQTRTLPITCISTPRKVWCAIFRLWVFGLRSSVEFGLRFMIPPPVLSRLWQPRQSKHLLKTEVTVFHHMNRPLAGK